AGPDARSALADAVRADRDRQPGQGRRRPGRAEPEPDARLRRGGRPAQHRACPLTARELSFRKFRICIKIDRWNFPRRGTIMSHKSRWPVTSAMLILALVLGSL